MKVIIILLAVMFGSNSWAECHALSEQGLSIKQIDVVRNSFYVGSQKNMSYSLAAIAWRESSAGKYLINLQDPSAGVFHVTINNALVYLKWKDTPFNRNRAAQLLIQNFDLAAEFAMLNLQFWYDQYGDNWRKVWRRYNGGYSDSKASREYSQDIAKKVAIISQCNWR